MRKILTNAIRECVKEMAYAFYYGPDGLVQSSIEEMPAAWLYPPKLIGHEGKRECRSVYHVSMALLGPGAKPFSCQAAADTWENLENNAVWLFRALQQVPNLQKVSNLKCTPSRMPLTKSGEYSVMMEFDAEVFYCV